MFTGTDRPSTSVIRITNIGSWTLAISVDQGLLRWQRKGGSSYWRLYDALYTAPDDKKPMLPTTLIRSGLEGYRFDNPRKRAPDSNFKTAIKVLATENDLASRTVRVEGDLVELIRNRTSQNRAGYSLKRALDKISEDQAGDQEERALHVVKKARY